MFIYTWKNLLLPNCWSYNIAVCGNKKLIFYWITFTHPIFEFSNQLTGIYIYIAHWWANAYEKIKGKMQPIWNFKNLLRKNITSFRGGVRAYVQLCDFYSMQSKQNRYFLSNFDFFLICRHMVPLNSIFALVTMADDCIPVSVTLFIYY